MDASAKAAALVDDVDDALSTREGAFALLERIAEGTSSEALVAFLSRLVDHEPEWLDVHVRAELTRRVGGTIVRVVGILGGGRRELMLPTVRCALPFDEVRSSLVRHDPSPNLLVVDGEDEAVVSRLLTSAEGESAMVVAIDESSLAATIGGLTPSSAPRPQLYEPWIVDEGWDAPAEERRTVPAPSPFEVDVDIEDRGPDTPRQRVSEELLERSRTNIPAMPDD